MSARITGYAQVVEEIVGGTVTRVYVHGHSLISQTPLINGNQVTSFYGFDGHGSVRLLTDGAGAITDTYTFGAFGGITTQTGTTPNKYLYTGEQLDPNLGFYYLRARYLNSSNGRFWTTDQFDGFLIEPISLHKYLYANADPTNRVDPTGNVSVIDPVAVAATRNTLQSIQIPIAKKVIAAILIAVLVAGVVAVTGPAFEEPANRLNSMRVQLSRAITISTPNQGTTSIPQA